MSAKSMPFHRYKPFPRVNLPDRQWPNQVVEVAPIWCPVDLRDGNQSLLTPMDIPKKRKLFDCLVRMGFRQIEVGFPASAQVEFDFIRHLIEEDAILDGVTMQVLTPARVDLIPRLFEAVQGAKRVIVHLYVSTSTLQRDVVFHRDRQEMIDLVVPTARLIRELAAERPETEWTFEFSPESFTGTELDFALEICSAVIAVWQPTPERKAIINLPATVELSTPNVYADMVEWMSRHLPSREAIVLSLHPHHDRGTGIAAAELGLLAGGERIEGTLFGNGERTGNVDLVILALSMMSQGVDPGLDISDIEAIVRIVEACTGMAVPPRHPYAGELAYLALSGGHQHAIMQGLAAQEARQDERWAVPYLAIDPGDIGRRCGMISITSQSGKGGIAYVMQQSHHIELPRGLLIDFGAIVQEYAERVGGVVDDAALKACFWQEYVDVRTPFELIDVSVDSSFEGGNRLSAEISFNGQLRAIEGTGNGPIDAFVRAISGLSGIDITVDSYEERAMGHGSEAMAIAFVSTRIPGHAAVWGVGIDVDSARAALLAVMSAVNRHQSRIVC